MAWIKTYRMQWDTMPVSRGDVSLNIDPQLVVVNIYDTSATADTSQVITMVPYADPLHIAVIDNDRDKFQPVRAKQAVLAFLTDRLRGIEIATFAESPDTRFLVEITSGGEMVFTGFIMPADIQQSFQPDNTIITVTASDHLGLLKDVDYTDTDGDNPKGKYRIAEFLATALKKTGLSLPIKICNNLRHIDPYQGDHFYDIIYLDAKTFEKSIGGSEDCYAVLEKILGEDCFITQWKGAWYIMRVDEYDNNLRYVANFDADGALLSIDAGADYNYSVGVANKSLMSRADMILQLDTRHKFVKETFNYAYPEELICNQDFSRGAGDPVDPTQANQTINLAMECWDVLVQDGSPPHPPTLPGVFGNLVKKYEHGYEKERYVALSAAVSGTPGESPFFQSSYLYVQQGDKINFSIDFRLDDTRTVTNIFPVNINLIGDDGFAYQWDYDSTTGVSSWVQKALSVLFFQNSFRVDMSGLDTKEWQNLSATSQPLPASGRLYIRLVSASVDFQVWFSNMSVEYIAFINGSYKQYTGQFTEVDRNPADGYNVNRDREVFISDSPNPNFKGTMFLDGLDEISTTFYTASTFGLLPPPGPDYFHPYGYIQAYSVWNQYRNANRIFSGSILGVADGANWPDLFHKYILTDADASTVSRYFMVISFDQNWKTNEMTCTFIEVYRTDIGKIYTDPLTFKYNG